MPPKTAASETVEEAAEETPAVVSNINSAAAAAGFVSEAFNDGEKIEPPKAKAKVALVVDEDDAEEEAEEEEAEEKPAEDDAEEEAKEEEAEEKPAPKAEEKKKSKSVPPAKRIAQITRRAHEAERGRAAAEAELARIRAAAGAPANGEGAEKPLTKPAKGAKDPDAPNPNDYQYGQLDDDYIADRVQYETGKALTAERAAEQTRRQAESAAQEEAQFKEDLDALVVRGLEQFEDFDELVVDGVRNKTWELTDALAKLLTKSEVGAEIAYHLASHPTEAKKIARLPPLEQAAWFGRKEAQLKPETPAPKKKKSQEPPALPTPPKHQARGSGGKFTPGPDSSDFAAVEALARSKGYIGK